MNSWCSIMRANMSCMGLNSMWPDVPRGESAGVRQMDSEPGESLEKR